MAQVSPQRGWVKPLCDDCYSPLPYCSLSCTPRHHTVATVRRVPRYDAGTRPDMATPKLDDDAKRDVRKEFDEAVSMTASQLERWLRHRRVAFGG